MNNTVELLHNTFEDILPILQGVYIGKFRNEMESMFHLAYWLYNDKHMNDTKVNKTIFNTTSIIINENTQTDLIVLINKAKEINAINKN